MKLTPILAMQFLACVAMAQEIDYPYKHDLKGPVQECSEKKFKARFGPEKIEVGEYIEDRKTGIRFFDRDGRLVEFRTHADSSRKYEKIVLTYNGSGCLQEMTEYHANGAFESSSTYTCNEQGKVIEKLDRYFLYERKPIAITAYTYDQDNHLTGILKKYGTPKRNSKKDGIDLEKDQYENRSYAYDQKGFMVKWTIKREGIDPEVAELFSGSADVVNDEQGRPVAEYSLNNSAAKEGRTKKLSKEMEYNSEGFLAKKVEYGKYLTDVKYYEYTYDDHGNWITKTQLMSSDKTNRNSGIPETVIIREIKYY